MNTSLNIPWKEIYNFILSCGNMNEIKSFSVSILSNLTKLCHFDQSLIYFLDGNRKICNQYLMNIDKQWSTLYLKYYSKTENGRYSLEKPLRENATKSTITIREWEKESSTEFVPKYIRPRGLKYSLGFALYDVNGIPRTVFALDRTTNVNFSDDELMILSLVVPLLNNLHKKFFCEQTSLRGLNQITWEVANLTEREMEILNLLCQGVSPTMISETLYISQSTTYKHISHIYEKMQVSSLQELLVRVLS